ncbi:MAG: amidohydrolase [Thermoprotei archaeon]
MASENIQALKSYVIEIRRVLHRRPELSFQEFETAKIIEAELRNMGLEPVRMAETGVVACIRGSLPGKTVAVRADMDGLPVTEENKVEYASRNPGVMHACGHDAHMAMLLGLAKLLYSNRNKLRGTVKLLFQPAEESPPGGAKKLIEEGAIDGVDYIIGQHVMSKIPAGKIAVFDRVAMANTDSFKIEISGKGGHGSAPHETVDVLLLGAEIVLLAQKIISRRVDPSKTAVLTFGTFNAGYRHNIIAAHAILTGTVRTFEEETRKLIENELEKIVSQVCDSSGVEHRLEYIRGYDAVVNDPGVTKIVENSAKKILGDDSVLRPPPDTGGEDFGEYLKRVPGSFYFFGVGNVDKKITSPQHSPTYNIDEDSLIDGVKILYESVLGLLSEEGRV